MEHRLHCLLDMDRTAEIRLDEEGCWFAVGDQPPVLLGPRRRVLRAILRVLARMVRDGRSEVGTEDLIREVWSDERLPHSVATNRLHFALWSLRELGMRGAIRATPHGYTLQGTTRVATRGHVPDESPARRLG